MAATSKKRADGVQLAVLTNRMQAIVRSMTNTLYRTGRSGVISVARDFSCCIVTNRHELLAAAESLPIHIMRGPDLMCEYMASVVPELRAGDAYLHNSPYDGNSHAGDLCLLVPVIADGKHRFTVVIKAHMADCGNSQPCTVFTAARDVYNEGALIFPCVKVYENYEERADVLRMCARRMRSPESWRGDFLGMVGAARIGERMILALGTELGWDALDKYVEDWFDYSEGRMAQAIRRLPRGRVIGVTHHDAFPGVEKKIPVKAEVAVDPEHARIAIDLTDNVDCVPNGLNLTEATASTAALIGVFMSIGGDVPLNAGSFRCIDIKLRENCAVGIPRFPASCSVATTNLADCVASSICLALADLDGSVGLAETATPNPPSAGWISGKDSRRRNLAYVNAMLAGFTGGAGGPAADGWLTAFHAGVSGMLMRDATEPTELLYPIVIWKDEIIPDTEGAGKHRGAPACNFEWGPADQPVEVIWHAGSTENPPRGARGGLAAAGADSRVRRSDGRLERVAAVNHMWLDPAETIVSTAAGGGGFGDPRERDPEAVLEDVREQWISRERARDVYAVEITVDLELDRDATNDLRE